MRIYAVVDRIIIKDLGDGTLRQCLTTLSLIPKVYSQVDLKEKSGLLFIWLQQSSASFKDEVDENSKNLVQL